MEAPSWHRVEDPVVRLLFFYTSFKTARSAAHISAPWQSHRNSVIARALIWKRGPELQAHSDLPREPAVSRLSQLAARFHRLRMERGSVTLFALRRPLRNFSVVFRGIRTDKVPEVVAHRLKKPNRFGVAAGERSRSSTILSRW